MSIIVSIIHVINGGLCGILKSGGAPKAVFFSSVQCSYKPVSESRVSGKIWSSVACAMHCGTVLLQTLNLFCTF